MLEDYLADCRRLTLSTIAEHVPRDSRHSGGLYQILLDYPLRPAKALRPALCLAVCQALGGDAQRALPSAAALELFHNAFLLHDDVEDGSQQRRHGHALHVQYGAPIAINVGDALLALALQPLLTNLSTLGLGPALNILDCIARMVRESVEGQMLELSWIREQRWRLSDREYLRMVHKKTGWYSFIAPCLIGAMAAGLDPHRAERLGRFGMLLGVAFQIQDDLLSLTTQADTGKDALGDLWEGKLTLVLVHALRCAPETERREALELLALPNARASTGRSSQAGDRALLDKLRARVPDLTPPELERLTAALGCRPEREANAVARLQSFVMRDDGASLRYAREVALRHARRAGQLLELELRSLGDSVHARFMRELVRFVHERTV